MSQFENSYQIFSQAKGFNAYVGISALVFSVINKQKADLSSSGISYKECVAALFEKLFLVLLVEIFCFLTWIFHLQLGVKCGPIWQMITHSLWIFLIFLSLINTTFTKMETVFVLLECLVIVVVISLLLKFIIIGLSWIWRRFFNNLNSNRDDPLWIAANLHESSIHNVDPQMVSEIYRNSLSTSSLHASPSGDHCQQKSDTTRRIFQNVTHRSNRNLEGHPSNENPLNFYHRSDACQGDIVYEQVDQIHNDIRNQTRQGQVIRKVEQQADLIIQQQVFQGMSGLSLSPNKNKRAHKIPYSPRLPGINRSTGGYGDTALELRVEALNQNHGDSQNLSTQDAKQASNGMLDKSNLKSNINENENSSEKQFVSKTRSGLIYSRFHLRK